MEGREIAREEKKSKMTYRVLEMRSTWGKAGWGDIDNSIEGSGELSELGWGKSEGHRHLDSGRLQPQAWQSCILHVT